MKPKLVDLDEIFKDHTNIFSKTEKIIEKPKVKNVQRINYKFNYKSFFNFAGLIIIFIGLYFLNKRKREKDERNKQFEGRIYKLKDIIKNNDEFIL